MLSRRISFEIQRTSLGRGVWRRYVALASFLNPVSGKQAYIEARALLKEYAHADAEQLADAQVKYLRTLLVHAYHNVPYYQDLFRQRGIGLASLQKLTDLEDVPLLDRQLIRQDLSAMRSRIHRPRDFQRVSTSGSTSTPLSLYWERNRTQGWEQAFISEYLSWFGVRHGSRVLRLGGELITNTSGIRYARPNTLHVSCDAYSAKRLPAILSEIQRFQPTVIHALPSTLYLFAQWLGNSGGLWRPSLELVWTSSEKLHSHQRRLFTDIFDCPMTDLYGNTERNVHIVECEAGSYHISPLYGYVEILNKDGHACAAGERGEIVGTAFGNMALPLIRYRTGDFASLSAAPCRCGRSWPVVEALAGKDSDYLVMADGEKLSVNVFWGQHFDFDGLVVEFSLEQHAPGLVQMHVVAPGSLDRAALQRIASLVNVIPGITIQVTQVERLKREGRGKLRMLRQCIAGDAISAASID